MNNKNKIVVSNIGDKIVDLSIQEGKKDDLLFVFKKENDIYIAVSFGDILDGGCPVDPEYGDDLPYIGCGWISP